jgi:hypothetical protein
MVNEQQVSLEIQVASQSHYPARSLYYWSRMFSTTLKEGGMLRLLVINDRAGLY